MRKKSQWRLMPAYAFSFGLFMSLSAAPALSKGLQPAASQPTISGQAAAGEGEILKPYQDTSGPGVYIILLDDPSVAAYAGGSGSLAATNPKASGMALYDNQEAVASYASFLQGVQQAFIKECESAFGHSIDVAFKYQHAVNGVAMTLTPDEAETISAMPGVRSVERETFQVPLTDAGPNWINAPIVWGHRENARHTRGAGVVVGVLDTGINSDHPSFAAVGGDGFVHTNPLGSGNFVPNSYCDLVDPSFCNDKLIGAWSFVPGDVNFPSPEDSDGHGSHTSSTAAGNFINGATLITPTTSFSPDISGVAPHANIIMYDVCVVSCPGSALVAAVNQVAIDHGVIPGGIASINYSISGGNTPYSDAVELGFLGLVDIGVYVAASAGNAGPGPGTTGHNSPWVAATAALTHNRIFVNDLIDMTSDGGPLANIEGLGLTSGFGPAPIINSADLEGAFPGSTLCGLGSIGDFIPPWPAGTFNGEIVACTRGTFGRVEKGANVLAAGAGGYILMDNGAGEVGDAHVLPGVHISLTERAILEAWLAANTNTTGSISGFEVNLDKANGDITAGFSSRGPNSSIDVIKPDIGAPGVSVYAAEANGQALSVPEYQFLSGTSMSSPHNAGSAALLTKLHPSWTPSEIKSALMSTSRPWDEILKEDGVTQADPFDTGAGRIDLEFAKKAGLVMDETTANYLAADPALGGDPRTLNTPSMQDSVCVGKCSFTRTVRNVSGRRVRWELGVWHQDEDLGVKLKPRRRIRLNDGESADITVTLDTAVLSEDWHFADLWLIGPGGSNNKEPNQHLPIAVFAAKSTNSNLLTKTVDNPTPDWGDILTYDIDITNGRLLGQIDLMDKKPRGARFIQGSETETITNGFTISPFSFNSSTKTLTWSGTLDEGGLQLSPGSSPFGYFPLSTFFAPFSLPSNCDDGGFILNVPTFEYNGQSYSQVIWSVNGTIEAGTASLLAASAGNQELPSATPPNNLIAPFWTDLNLCAAGNWYVGNLSAGGGVFQWTVYEWENVPLFDNTGDLYTFQVWVETVSSPGIFGTQIVYQRLDDVLTPSGVTVGVENENGSVGSSYFFEGAGTEPMVGFDLVVEQLIGGTANFTFQVKATCGNHGRIVNEVKISTADESHRAIASARCW